MRGGRGNRVQSGRSLFMGFLSDLTTKKVEGKPIFFFKSFKKVWEGVKDKRNIFSIFECLFNNNDRNTEMNLKLS